MAVFDYEMNQNFAIDYEKMKWEEIRAKMAPYRDPANYRFLREMPCDDVSALVLRDLDIFLNRYEFSSVMRSPAVLVGSMEPDSVAKEDAVMMAVDTAILGADEPSLLGRLMVLRALSSDLGRNYSEAPSMYDSIYQNRLAYMNREVLRVQAGRLLEQARRRNTLTYALPDTEGGKLLRRLTEKYRGKYVLIDFWGMFCGPCRSGIERSKPMREALRNHPDVDFLFISTEGCGRTPVQGRRGTGESRRLQPSDGVVQFLGDSALRDARPHGECGAERFALCAGSAVPFAFRGLETTVGTLM